MPGTGRHVARFRGVIAACVCAGVSELLIRGAAAGERQLARRGRERGLRAGGPRAGRAAARARAARRLLPGRLDAARARLLRVPLHARRPSCAHGN